MSVAQEDIPATQEKVLERKCDYLEWTKYMSRLHRMDLRLLVNTVSEEVQRLEKVIWLMDKTVFARNYLVKLQLLHVFGEDIFNSICCLKAYCWHVNQI